MTEHESSDGAASADSGGLVPSEDGWIPSVAPSTTRTGADDLAERLEVEGNYGHPCPHHTIGVDEVCAACVQHDDDCRVAAARLRELEADNRRLATTMTGDTATDLRVLYAFEAGLFDGRSEQGARIREDEFRMTKMRERVRELEAVEDDRVWLRAELDDLGHLADELAARIDRYCCDECNAALDRWEQARGRTVTGE